MQGEAPLIAVTISMFSMSASGSGRGGCAGTECLWTLFETEIRIALCRDGHRPRQSDAARATECCGMPAPVWAPRASRATRPLEAPCSVRERFLSSARTSPGRRDGGSGRPSCAGKHRENRARGFCAAGTVSHPFRNFLKATGTDTNMSAQSQHSTTALYSCGGF